LRHLQDSEALTALILADSKIYDVSYDELYGTLNCESGLDPSIVGDHGTSYGIAQIHLPAHPDITKSEALDPQFSVNFAAHEFSKGRQAEWSCYKLLYK
jgi:hypothetical protein